ncbi:DUF5928 domain-containing protein [Brevirhabdus sp.]|uniref:DUF5928 domain-containing protein n=1 Tax=Brevirhabdus sp. TaxID=2004514 RepID=UPI004058480D
MAKIAFILLCHKDPDAVISQARRLTAAGDYMAIHFDASAPRAAYDEIRAALKDNPNVVFAGKRVKCGWGAWSLVQATLLALRAALDAFAHATHFYMLSGDCMAIKSADYAHEFLDRRDVDYIESFDFFESDWIKTDLKEERLVYRHFFNERKNKALFYASVNLQRRLKLTRRIPGDLQIMIGSQWWCLRRRTCENIVEFCDSRPEIVRFFRTTWIPDETFFQTLVRHLVPEAEIDPRTLTFLMFSDYGMPVTFYNDHFDLLLTQNFLFARKISPDARELRARLGALYASGKMDFQISDEGRRLHRFLAGRGRIGRRFAPRFWEAESTLGRERELLIVSSKKWHVAKRLLERIRQVTNLPGVEYLFDEESSDLPDLGGIQSSLGKRARHRRALMRMIFDHFESDRLIICLDPKNLEMINDFYSDRCVTRLLEVECNFSDAYLTGHARRVGLASPQTPPETMARLLPTIRNDVLHESDQIRDANFPHIYRISENAGTEENAMALASFLGVSEERATEIASSEHLFVD